MKKSAILVIALMAVTVVVAYGQINYSVKGVDEPFALRISVCNSGWNPMEFILRSGTVFVQDNAACLLWRDFRNTVSANDCHETLLFTIPIPLKGNFVRMQPTGAILVDPTAEMVTIISNFEVAYTTTIKMNQRVRRILACRQNLISTKIIIVAKMMYGHYELADIKSLLYNSGLSEFSILLSADVDYAVQELLTNWGSQASAM